MWLVHRAERQGNQDARHLDAATPITAENTAPENNGYPTYEAGRSWVWSPTEGEPRARGRRMTATVEIPIPEETRRAGRDSAKVDAIGTRLRLRALTAMGHSDQRIAQALGRPAWLITRIINRSALTVTPELRADACRLFDAWWDKRPPEQDTSRTAGGSGSQGPRAAGPLVRRPWPGRGRGGRPGLPAEQRVAAGHRHRHRWR